MRMSKMMYHNMSFTILNFYKFDKLNLMNMFDKF